MESLELFGREVLPEFAERDGAAGRREGRSGSRRVVDAALARKPASDHPPLPTADYDVPGDPA